MYKLINKKYLCICILLALVLSFICSPVHSVYASDIAEGTQEITTNVEVPTGPTEPADEGTDATEPTAPVAEEDVPVDETEPIEGDGEAAEPSEPETIKQSVDYKLVITTVIQASDVYYINGSPTFIYRIEQLADDGTVAKYWYKSVTIEKEYTELMTDQNGFVCVEIEIILASGIYRVTSEQTGRYNAHQKEQGLVLDFLVVEVPVASETDDEPATESAATIQSETVGEMERKDLIFFFTKSGSKNLPSSSCAATPGCASAEYVGISLKANKSVYDAGSPIMKDDFALLLVKSDGSTEEVSLNGVCFDFSTRTDIFPNMSSYPDVNGAIKVSVSYAFDGIAYYTDTVINLYQEPYIIYLETALKAGKTDNGQADHYIVTAVYSDGTRQLLLPAVTENEGVVILNSGEVNGKWTRNFQFTSYLSIKFINNSSTSGVSETLTINGNVLYGNLNDLRIAGDKIEIEWDGSSDWTMVITPVSTANGESCVPTYTMIYSGGKWTAVLV